MPIARMSQPGIPPRDPLLGARLDGRYRIRSVHGRGGMGVVYAAVHEDLRRDVAVKVLDKNWATDRNAIERFLQEARTASGLSHGNIVDVLDLGRLPDGRPYLVMPLILGADLATVLAEEGPQHPKRVATLLTGVASALDLIHAKGLVHHDIKPENLMRVQREDGSETVVVLDFGIAGARFPLDGRGMELFDRGTPEFMPPEAASGVVPDRRGDIYALATVAFELMTGRLPFDSNDDAELATLKATRPPSSMTFASGHSFPLALEAVVARGLATRPAERYPTAGEFVRRIAHVAAQIADDFMTRTDARSAGGPVLQAPPRPQRRAVASRSRTLMTAGGLLHSSPVASVTANVNAPALRGGAQESGPAPALRGGAQESASPRQENGASGAQVGTALSTAQTLPQMHAVEVAAPQSDAPPAPSAEAQLADTSGARALPREPQAAAPPPATPESKTASSTPGGVASSAPDGVATGTLSGHPTASVAPATMPAPAYELPAGVSGPRAPAEDHTTEASGTFLRKGTRDTRNSRSPLRSSARAAEASARPSAAPPITVPPAAPDVVAAAPQAPVASTAPAGVTAPELPAIASPVPAPAARAGNATAPMFAATSGSWPSARAATAGATAVAPPVAAAASASAEDDLADAVFVPDAPDPPEPDERDDLDDEDDVMDDAAVAAEFHIDRGDDRETVPGELRPRRSVLFHPALLTVFGAALLFWLYAVLPERDLTTEELPSTPRSAAPTPIMPHTPAVPARVPALAPIVMPPPSAATRNDQAPPVTPTPTAEAASAVPAATLGPAAQPAADEQAALPTPAARRAARLAARAAALASKPASKAQSKPAPAPAPAPAVVARPPRAVNGTAPALRGARASEKPTSAGRTPAELVRQAEDALMSGQLASAADLYQLAITTDSSYAPAYRGKGLVLERLGRTRDAADAFRVFLRLSPNAPAAAKIREHLEALSE